MDTWQDTGPCSVEGTMVESCGLHEPLSAGANPGIRALSESSSPSGEGVVIPIPWEWPAQGLHAW